MKLADTLRHMLEKEGVRSSPKATFRRSLIRRLRYGASTEMERMAATEMENMMAEIDRLREQIKNWETYAGRHRA